MYPKFLGPYKVTSVLRNNRYLVEKHGDHEGPTCTSSSADHMKPWPQYQDFGSNSNDNSNSESDEEGDTLQGIKGNAN